jgi:hypothetical protein
MIEKFLFITVAMLVPLLQPLLADTAPTSAPSDVVGKYTANIGDPAHDRFYSIMHLDLKADGSMTLANTMPDIANPGQKIENKAEGKWTKSDDKVTITLEKGNGKEISADDPKKTLTLTASDDCKRLRPDNGPEFKRD